VGEALRLASLRVTCNTDGSHSADMPEEFSYSIFSGVEAHIATEDGVRLGGGTTSFGHFLRELNVKDGAIELSSINGTSLGGILVLFELNESALLIE